MSWTAPRTWVAGEVELASFFNAQLRDNLAVLATAIDTTNGKFQAVTAAYVLSLAGIVQLLNINTTLGANSGAGETDLITYSMPGGTLANAGQAVRITAWGSTANNSNVKTIRVYFGTDARGFVGNLAINTLVTYGWTTLVARLGPTSQTRVDRFVGGPTGAAANSAAVDGGVISQTLSGAIVIKITGQSSVSSQINAQGLMTEIIQQ